MFRYLSPLIWTGTWWAFLSENLALFQFRNMYCSLIINCVHLSSFFLRHRKWPLCSELWKHLPVLPFMPLICFSVARILLMEESHFHGIDHKDWESLWVFRKDLCAERKRTAFLAAQKSPDGCEPWWSHLEMWRIIIATPASQVQQKWDLWECCRSSKVRLKQLRFLKFIFSASSRTMISTYKISLLKRT